MAARTIQDMPQWTSHKQVRAAPILKMLGRQVSVDLGGGDVLVVEVPANLFDRYYPSEGDFLVIYADGYMSVSPAQPFREGYTPVRDLTRAG